MSQSILRSFTFSAYRLTLRAIDELNLPGYKGSAIRGSFGHVFRQVCCISGRGDCTNCAFRHRCIYVYVFETTPPQADTFLRKTDKSAHPYVLRPPLDDRRRYAPGEQVSFEVILIGKATAYLSHFVHAFILMGERGLGRGNGKFILSHVNALELDGTARRIYNAGDRLLKDQTITISCRELAERYDPPGQITFRFLTRLELKEKGMHPDIRFGVLFRALLRRITTLAHLHCGIDCSDIDFQELSHAADEIETVSSNLEWEDSIRYSNRQKKRMPFGGVVGEVTFAGDLSVFWPFILLGKWVHVGKKTTFGFGRYELVITK